jgi:hypothetical protein
MNFSIKLKAKAMIDALSAHAPALEIGVIERIGQETESSMISHPLASNLDSLLAWAGVENTRKQANVYIRPVPAIAHPWLFLDDLPESVARKIAGKYAALVIETTSAACTGGEANCQIRLLAFRDLNSKERYAIQSALVMLLQAGDPASTAGDKWGRLVGFKNRKSGRESWTNLLANTLQSRPAFDPEQILKTEKTGSGFSRPLGGPWSCKQTTNAPQPVSKSSSFGGGDSTKEFAFACHSLRAGKPKDDVIRLVAEHALERGKRPTAAAAERYAVKTVTAAENRLRPV